MGNHERDWPGQGLPYGTIDSGGECGVPYTARFPMPTSGQREQPWYSFDHGPVHFAVISTEHHYTEGSPQHAWLAADLAGVERSRTPWLVLVGHRCAGLQGWGGCWSRGDGQAVAAGLAWLLCQSR